jgi:ABC-2 type transport system ATP-binding protein
MEPLVTFSDLTIRYGTTPALQAVSGQFPAGATGLLGPNGAGKTSLLKTLLGFLVPTSGEIRAFGLDPGREPLEVRRRIGYMPEVDCHIPDMTASGFVAFAGELSGMPRAEAISRAHEVLDYVGLGEARYRTLQTFSTGMKQRAKLAQALVHDPDLLLLDEPTNGLDPGGREEMLALIGDIARRGQMSLVLCSHLLPDVERVCERVLLLNLGKVAAQGTIAELTGPRLSTYEVRVKGDRAAFVTDLKDRGCTVHEEEDGVRVLLPDGMGADTLFGVAREARVQIRHLRPGAETLEDVFLRALA